MALSDYHMIEPLASGGMGTLWRARHRLLRRDVAIKFMRVEGRDEMARARFSAEARVTASLSSPHAVRVFDFGATDDGELFYAMELLRGCEVETLVRRFGPLPAERVCHLLVQVCDAIAELHQRGLVHGDIKPANLYTCRMGLHYDFAKLLDFGLAQPTPRCVDTGRVRRVTLGTPAYMAPEVVRTGGVDQRADLYALGCVAYFLLTGRLVFEANTPAELLWHHLHSEPAPPSSRTECAIPRVIDDLVLGCLRKEPASRIRCAAEVGRYVGSIGGSWSQAAAKRWWNAHLPECADPCENACECTSIESHESSLCPSSDVFVQWTV